jgi:hypothetical protein
MTGERDFCLGLKAQASPTFNPPSEFTQFSHSYHHDVTFRAYAYQLIIAGADVKTGGTHAARSKREL